jgi:hypothetical protein
LVVGRDDSLHIVDVMLVAKIEMGPPIAAGVARADEAE